MTPSSFLTPVEPTSSEGGAGHSIKLAEAAAEETARRAGAPIETFAAGEHRIGLKLATRRVWAPIGVQPIARGHHRFEWLHVTAFVSPPTGKCFWRVANGVSKPFFEELLRAFAEEAGAGKDRIVVLVLDNAGWRAEAGLVVPDGVRLVFLPPYTPEVQAAEYLWAVVDEPIVNRRIADVDTLDAIISARCAQLANHRETIRGRTGFHWRPSIASPN
jgi:transposase